MIESATLIAGRSSSPAALASALAAGRSSASTAALAAVLAPGRRSCAVALVVLPAGTSLVVLPAGSPAQGLSTAAHGLSTAAPGLSAAAAALSAVAAAPVDLMIDLLVRGRVLLQGGIEHLRSRGRRKCKHEHNRQTDNAHFQSPKRRHPAVPPMPLDQLLRSGSSLTPQAPFYRR